MKKVVIAFDHRGQNLANGVKKHFEKLGYTVSIGESHDGDDYVDNAIPALKGIVSKTYDFGVLICGTGVGMAIVANRHKGILAVHANDEATAHFARRHEDANVLVLGAGYEDDDYAVKALSLTKACKIVDAFINAEFEGGRHKKRVNKVNKI